MDKLKDTVKIDSELYENAKKILAQLDVEIAELKKDIAECSERVKTLKPFADTYMKAKSVIDEVKYYNDEELFEKAREEVRWYKSVFPLFFIELQYHGLPDEAYVMPILVELARQENVPLIAANDAHMKDNSDDSIESRRIVRYNMISKAQEVRCV